MKAVNKAKKDKQHGKSSKKKKKKKKINETWAELNESWHCLSAFSAAAQWERERKNERESE